MSQALREAIIAADLFFREAMPKLNVKDSCLDANAIEAWNKAEIAVSRAMHEITMEQVSP